MTIHTHTYVSHTHICIYMYTYIYIYIFMCIYIYMYIKYIHLCIYTCTGILAGGEEWARTLRELDLSRIPFVSNACLKMVALRYTFLTNLRVCGCAKVSDDGILYVNLYVHIYTYMYIFIYKYSYICICIYTHVYIRMQIHYIHRRSTHIHKLSSTIRQLQPLVCTMAALTTSLLMTQHCFSCATYSSHQYTEYSFNKCMHVKIEILS